MEMTRLMHAGELDAIWGAWIHVKEACRDMRTLRPVEHFLHDLRFGARLLARGRGFTTVAVVSLALGIGASSAIFSLINAIVLRPLPVADPHELYIAQAMEPHEVDLLFSSPVVERAAELLAGRAEVAAQSSTESVLIATREAGDASPPEAARLQLVAGDFFGTLRQRAQIGRLLGPDDNRTVGQHPVAVISDRYWSRRFGRYSARAGYRADHQRRTDGYRWRCGSGVFWCDGRQPRRRTSGHQQRCRRRSGLPGTSSARVAISRSRGRPNLSSRGYES